MLLVPWQGQFKESLSKPSFCVLSSANISMGVSDDEEDVAGSAQGNNLPSSLQSYLENAGQANPTDLSADQRENFFESIGGDILKQDYNDQEEDSSLFNMQGSKGAREVSEGVQYMNDQFENMVSLKVFEKKQSSTYLIWNLLSICVIITYI